MGNGDGIVPPQGMNVINEKRTIYGLPLAIPAGGGGTKVTAKFPKPVKFPAGMSVKITGGTYSPAPPPPPPHSGGNEVLRTGSGMVLRVMTASPSVRTGGSGTKIKIMTPIFIKIGSGQKAAKV
jgi:hypothetical protein